MSGADSVVAQRPPALQCVAPGYQPLAKAPTPGDVTSIW